MSAALRVVPNDTDLLDAVERFQALHDAIQAMEDEGSNPGTLTIARELRDAEADRIMEMQPQTELGLRRKAGVVLASLDRTEEGTGSWGWQILRDMLRFPDAMAKLQAALVETRS